MVVAMGPWPSIGRPSASTTRPIRRGTDRHLEHAGGATHLVAFLQLEVVAEHDGADVVLFEVEREGVMVSPVSEEVISSISPAIAF
jgi:hypothetical protein